MSQVASSCRVALLLLAGLAWACSSSDEQGSADAVPLQVESMDIDSMDMAPASGGQMSGNDESASGEQPLAAPSEDGVVDQPDAAAPESDGQLPAEQEPGPTVCDACNAGSECPEGGGCIRISGGPRFCTAPCVGVEDCAEGYRCFDLGPYGQQCLPESGMCDDAADNSGEQPGEDSAAMTPESTAQAVTCDDLGDWPDDWQQFEQEVLMLVNQVRAQGANCGGTTMPPVGPLSSNAILTCTARAHSQDMAQRDFFSHDNPDGLSPSERVRAAGYDFRASGENIAYGQRDPVAVMDGWLSSPGHCGNIMQAGFTEIGIGYYFEEDPDSFRGGSGYWTQNFGRPR